jgi:hypothetical protein
MPVHATLGQRAVMGLSWQHVPHMIHVDRTRAAQAPFQQGDSPRSQSGRTERTEIPAGETRPCEVHAAAQYALVRAVRRAMSSPMGARVVGRATGDGGTVPGTGSGASTATADTAGPDVRRLFMSESSRAALNAHTRSHSTKPFNCWRV